MEYEEIAKLISYDEKFPDNISKFTSKKLVEVYDQNDNADYRENKQVRFKAPMLRSDLCNYSDAYIVVKGNINLESDRTNADNVNAYDKKVAFKNNAPFISCITKINGELIENAEDLDIVMPMYNLLEYSKSYRKLADLCLIITGMNQIVKKMMTISIFQYKIQHLLTIKLILCQ